MGRQAPTHNDPIVEEESRCHQKPGVLSEEERTLLVEYLLVENLPPREIIRVAGVSSRTVSRVMQRLGLRRRNVGRVSSSRKRHTQRLHEILSQYYALEEVTLDALDQLAGGNDLSLKVLLDLIREHVSPSRWAIRACLGPCGQPALTPSPGDRYCPACKKKIKKDRMGIQEDMLYS
ncbi:hypothetical protein [Candidatus Manganitrophus noduliformans]|uniref:Uncharacterized protein n=1 Tax=Candidatus Manganitrophus noduliformans TaxID=2606439 RepID=A0A7X6ICR3_9BACT|nr:hypothetical protein [Candidatus Manganitrophus noduliformans]NKE72816.1 hypothetical protein [Candidatus Manganitrophus noduliformans]